MYTALSDKVEKFLMPVATKLSTQRHLRAIRDSFIALLPITLMGGVVSVINSAPVTKTTTNPILLAWAGFASNNSAILSWISALTLGAMSLYICIGMTYFLCKHYKIEPFIPTLIAVLGFVMLITNPIKLGFDAKSIDISYIDGKGLIPAILLAIINVELYNFMRSREWGKIKLPDSVPQSLSEVFASLVPAFLLIVLYSLIFTVFNKLGTFLPKYLYGILSPTFKAADSLPFAIFITFLVQFFWFFGIHDAALAGILGPIRDGNLSVNAAAQMAGKPLPFVFTTSFWVYFVIIGGCGSVLALAVLLVRSKSVQLKTVGRIGLIPSLFGISEPITFGVPLMLNPIFFIPFTFTSTINAGISFILMHGGVIKKTYAMLSWNMPNFFGAFLSTMDWKAFILVVGLFVLDVIIYYPFFKIYEKQMLKLESENEQSAEVENSANV